MVGREGRGPVDVITAVPGEPEDFGDGTRKFQQEVPAPTPRGSQSKASAAHRRATAYGGFGFDEHAYDAKREKAAGGAAPADTGNRTTGY